MTLSSHQSHIGRFQEYLTILIGSNTLQFLQWCKYPFLGSKINRGFILKLTKRFLDGATIEIFDMSKELAGPKKFSIWKFIALTKIEKTMKFYQKSVIFDGFWRFFKVSSTMAEY